ncbi:thioredoxin [Candidatus Bathyarchaeota archaeon]|nr:MAG: thioredoxin [Candidatus Bathyarchaeota archaeon]
MPVKIEVYTSPTCPYCPHAVKLLDEIAPSFGQNVTVEEVNSWSEEGQTRALKYGIMAVPTIVINGKVRFVGVPKKDELVRAIREEVGRETKSK